MKAIILSALKEWVINKVKYGEHIWREVATELGFGVDKFTSQDNFSNRERFLRLIELICKKTSKTDSDFKTEFEQYWMTDYAPRLYNSLTRQSPNAKEFLKAVSRVNNEFCTIFPNNTFIGKVDASDINEHSLTVIYANEKTLVDIVAILRGVSSYYHETFTVKKINPHSSEIRFEPR